MLQMLVVDIPVNSSCSHACKACPCSRSNVDAMGDGEYICGHQDRKLTYMEYHKERPDWCCMAAIPHMKECDDLADVAMRNYGNGWDACILEILKRAKRQERYT